MRLRKQDWVRLKEIDKIEKTRLNRLIGIDWENKIERIDYIWGWGWGDWENKIEEKPANNGHTIVNTMVTQLFSNCITNADNCMTMYDYWMTVSFLNSEQ